MHCTGLKGLDKSHFGTPGPEKSRVLSFIHDNLKLDPINIENFQAICNTLQAKTTFAACSEDEKPVKVCQLEQKIVRL